MADREFPMYPLTRFRLTVRMILIPIYMWICIMYRSISRSESQSMTKARPARKSIDVVTIRFIGSDLFLDRGAE